MGIVQTSDDKNVYILNYDDCIFEDDEIVGVKDGAVVHKWPKDKVHLLDGQCKSEK